MDTIFIRDLRVAGKHGVMAHERKVEQEFIIDIEANFNASRAGQSDDLADTLDYARMRAIVLEIFQGQTSYLIEHLAEMIAQRILIDARIERVSVTIRKPSVFPSGVPGVSIVRTHH